MKYFIFLTLVLSYNFSFSAEGFQPSKEKNVVMLKGSTSGGTAFILNHPSLGLILITQKHVLEISKGAIILQWGHEVGPLFRLNPIEDGAYQFEFTPVILWQDDDLDVAVIEAPNGLAEHCHCTGFEIGSFKDGPASLIGYPIIERRIWPRTSSWIWMWRELWAHVKQQVSVGNVWKTADEYLGDIDSISGNSGGPIVQNGKVIGVIHLLKTWKGEGYRYKNPSLNFVPIETVIQALANATK